MTAVEKLVLERRKALEGQLRDWQYRFETSTLDRHYYWQQAERVQREICDLDNDWANYTPDAQRT